MLPRGLDYPVTKEAVRAIERGMRRRGINKTELAGMLDVTKQAVGQALQKADKEGACEFLPDMLRAVGEDELLAFPALNDMQKQTLLYLSEIGGQMEPDEYREFLDSFTRAWRETRSRKNDTGE